MGLIDQWLGISAGKDAEQERQIKLATQKKALQDLLNPPTLGQELNAPKSTPEQDAAFTQAMKDYQARKTAMPTTDQAATNTTLGIPAAPAPAMPTSPRDQYAKNIGLNNADQLNIPSSQVGSVEKLQQGSYWAGRNEATATKAAGGKIWYNPTNLSYSEVQRPGDILVKNETAATQASFPGRQDIQQENALGRIGAQDDLREKRAVLQQRYQMRNDPQIKKLNDQGIGLDQVDSVLQLAQQGNTVAGSALGVKMAKAMGEVGVLTEQDVNRYITSGQLGQHAADILSKWATGVPTDATLNDISQIAGVMKDSYNKMTQPITNGYVESLARNYGMDPERAAYLLSVNYAPTQAQQPQHPQTPTQPAAPASGGKTRSGMGYKVVGQ